MQKEWARVARVTPAGARLRVDTTTSTSSIRSSCLKDYPIIRNLFLWTLKGRMRSNLIQLNKISVNVKEDRSLDVIHFHAYDIQLSSF